MDKSTKIAWGITFAAIGVGVWLENKARSKGNIPNTYTQTDMDMSRFVFLPRGYRNNNPLNIRISANDWRGKIKPNTDGTFEQFIDMAYGYRAALVTMRTYIKKYGLNTIAKIISRWAPENENNTSGYINHVCNLINMSPDTKVAINDRDTLTKMAYAMSIIENGNTAETQKAGLPDMEIINEGWDLI